MDPASGRTSRRKRRVAAGAASSSARLDLSDDESMYSDSAASSSSVAGRKRKKERAAATGGVSAASFSRDAGAGAAPLGGAGAQSSSSPPAAASSRGAGAGAAPSGGAGAQSSSSSHGEDEFLPLKTFVCSGTGAYTGPKGVTTPFYKAASKEGFVQRMLEKFVPGAEKILPDAVKLLDDSDAFTKIVKKCSKAQLVQYVKAGCVDNHPRSRFLLDNSKQRWSYPEYDYPYGKDGNDAVVADFLDLMLAREAIAAAKHKAAAQKTRLDSLRATVRKLSAIHTDPENYDERYYAPDDAALRQVPSASSVGGGERESSCVPQREANPRQGRGEGRGSGNRGEEVPKLVH